MRLIAAFVAAFVCVAAASPTVRAQNAVTMIVGYPPGGATDLMARIMQPESPPPLAPRSS